MNRSFAGFLSNRASKSYRKELKKALQDENKWSGYKYAIWLVIIALFVFLILTNQEYLGNLEKLFALVIASIGGVTNLTDYFAQKTGKSSA